MGPENLSICIAPNVLSAPPDKTLPLEASLAANTVFSMMIEYYPHLFDGIIFDESMIMSDGDIAELSVEKKVESDKRYINYAIERYKLRNKSLIPAVAPSEKDPKLKCPTRPPPPPPVEDKKDDDDWIAMPFT